jgi:hypothetical protein
MYSYIAVKELKDRGLVKAVNSECIMKIVAESKIDINSVDGMPFPYLYSIKVHYYEFDPQYNVLIDLARGATGNGSFYFFLPVKQGSKDTAARQGGFRLVGIVFGDSYNLQMSNNVPLIVCKSNISAQSGTESEYSWNGQMFSLLSRRHYTPENGRWKARQLPMQMGLFFAVLVMAPRLKEKRLLIQT